MGVLSPVLGVLARRLKEYEYDVWLLVVYFMGFRWGDPLMDWEKHVGKLEAAIGRLPAGWASQRPGSWESVLQAGISRELGEFVWRAVYPRSRDRLLAAGELLRHQPIPLTLHPDNKYVASRRRCCSDCAFWGVSLLIPLRDRVGDWTIRLIFAIHAERWHEPRGVEVWRAEFGYIVGFGRGPYSHGNGRGDLNTRQGSILCRRGCWDTKYRVRFASGSAFQAPTVAVWGGSDERPYEFIPFVADIRSHSLLSMSDGRVLAMVRPDRYDLPSFEFTPRLP